MLWLEFIEKKRKLGILKYIQTILKNFWTLSIRVTYLLFFNFMYHLFFCDYSSMDGIEITKRVSDGFFSTVTSSYNYYIVDYICIGVRLFLSSPPHL